MIVQRWLGSVVCEIATSCVSVVLVVVADVRSKVLAPFLLGSFVCEITRS